MKTDWDALQQAPVGAATMSPAMREMHSYCRYLYRLVRPGLGRRVWEIGVGHGNYTQLLRQDDRHVLATDIDDHCLAAVRTRFRDDAQVKTARVDLTNEASVRAQAAFQADSIMSLNVLEHIPGDITALAWLRQSVGREARLALIVPAMPQLYGRMDSEAGHCRRYTRSSLQHVLHESGWRVDSLRYVNLLGALGWFYHNRVRRQAGLRDRSVNRQMRIADRLLPVVGRLTDPICSRLAGLSVLGLATSSDRLGH